MDKSGPFFASVLRLTIVMKCESISLSEKWRPICFGFILWNKVVISVIKTAFYSNLKVVAGLTLITIINEVLGESNNEDPGAA